MRDDILKTVEVLRGKIRVKEEEASRIKRIINDLYTEEGENPPYSNISTETTATLNSLRSDQFYGLTLAGATRQYLEMRKASGMGAASIVDIFQALKGGGYKFDAKTDEYAKNGVRIALRKNSVTFHRLPNGDYGLLSWYERPKSGNGESGTKPNVKRRKGRKKNSKAESQSKTKKIGVEPVKSELGQPNGTSISRSLSILNVLRSDKNKEWDHRDVHKHLPNVDVELIRPLLYSLAKTKKAVKTSPGKFRAV